jgi:tetratricopeptide (TPR) repeat protein
MFGMVLGWAACWAGSGWRGLLQALGLSPKTPPQSLPRVPEPAEPCPGSDQSRLAELSLAWEERFEQGWDVPAEYLCKDCPSLVEPLNERILALKELAWVKRPVEDDGPELPTGSELETHPDLPLPRQLAGRYRLDELIGEGGFGQVWQGFDLKLQRRVAVKVPKRRRSVDPEQQDAFLSEARKVARLRHPGIVSVYDVGQEDGAYFIVSELIEGTDLRKRLRARPIPVRDVAQIVAQVAGSLHHAHELDFVHRDIKPANILLDGSGAVFVTDFGIAVTEAELQLQGPECAGTVGYMSPEQLDGDPSRISKRTDIYSLGLVLYELLAGRFPFPAEPPVGAQDGIPQQRPVSPRSINRAVPRTLERVCLKCLARNPEGRYPTAKALADDLKHWLDRPPWHYTAGKAFLWIGGTCGLLGLALGLMLFLSRKAPEQPKEAGTPGERDDLKDTQAAVGYYEQGAKLENNREDARAIEYYTEAIHKDPSMVKAYFRRGIIYEMTREYDAAIADYTKALQLDPQYADAYHHRGNAHMNKREYDEAIADFTRAIQLNPRYADAYHHRGYVHNQKREFDKAIPDFTEAVRYDPKLANAFFGRGYAHSERREFDQAIPDFTEAIRLKPQFANAYHNRGYAHSEKGEFDKAVPDLTEAIRLYPKEPNSYYRRGYVHNNRGAYDQAIPDFTEAIRLDPKNSYGYRNRGRAYSGKREYDKAVADHTEALRLDPNDPDVYMDFAWLLATCPKDELRDGELAVRYAVKACELSNWNHVGCLATLAAAHAEKRDFKAAVEWQKSELRPLGETGMI